MFPLSLTDVGEGARDVRERITFEGDGAAEMWAPDEAPSESLRGAMLYIAPKSGEPTAAAAAAASSSS